MALGGARESENVDDLERLFRELVKVVRTDDPDRVRHSFQVSELYQSILPYRGFKRLLQFDSSEDYDMAILRLLAGERGYASVEPIEVQQQLALEAQSINPAPGLYREFAAAKVTLNDAAIPSGASDVEAYGPPEMRSDTGADRSKPRAPAEPGRRKADSTTLVFEPVLQRQEPESPLEPAPAPTRCSHCDRRLPEGRQISFCPFCGSQVTAQACARCGSEIERGWRFCVVCGEPIDRR